MSKVMEGISPLPWGFDPVRYLDTSVVGNDKHRRLIASTGGYSSNTVEDNGRGENMANAAYIVHACNLYPELVEALNGLMKYGHPDWPECQHAMSVLAKCKAGAE